MHNNIYSLHKSDNTFFSAEEKSQFAPLLKNDGRWVINDNGRYKDHNIITDMVKGAEPFDIPKGNFWEELTEENMSKNEKKRRKRRKLDLLKWGDEQLRPKAFAEELALRMHELHNSHKCGPLLTREEINKKGQPQNPQQRKKKK